MARCWRSPVQNRLPSVQSESRGFGVKTRSSSGSSLTAVKGLESAEFLPCPMKIVSKSSSLTSASPSTAKIAHFAYLIIDSKTPPKCDAAGWFPFQLTPLLEVIRSILSWSIAGTTPCSSLDALTNFVPPSINICCDHPLRAVILTKALRNASVSKDDTISKWHQGSSNREKTQIKRSSHSSTSLLS